MLRIMFLNTWGGELWDELRQFIIEKKLGDGFDIFCFSEVHRLPGGEILSIKPEFPGSRKNDVFIGQYEALRDLLPQHDGYYTAHGEYLLHDLERTSTAVRYGNAMFISHTLPVFFSSDMVFRRFNQTNDGAPASRSIQGAIIRQGREAYVLVHFHGIWTGGGKNDTMERFEQSKRAGDFALQLVQRCRQIHGLEPNVIIGGDFNLTSRTESLKMLAHAPVFGGLGRILNHEFRIQDTRTQHYAKAEREADFVLASANVRVRSFEAPDQPAVSDHRPLILECD